MGPGCDGDEGTSRNRQFEDASIFSCSSWKNISSRVTLLLYFDQTFSLRLALLNEAKEVRAAGLRSLRYLIRDTAVLQKVLRLQVDYLIAR